MVLIQAISDWNTSRYHGDYVIDEQDWTKKEDHARTVVDVIWTMIRNDSDEHLPTNTSNINQDCFEWQETQHIIFQVANLILVVSFLAPSYFKYHTLFLRGLSSVSCFMIILWTAIVSCLPDYLGWNIAFLIVNMVHIVYHLCTSYPTKFDPVVEEVYKKIFKPFKVSRLTFNELVALGDILKLETGDVYAVEEDTLCNDSLSLLVCGRARVTCENFFLHLVEPYQFLDSAEFEARHPYCSEEQEFYQVTVTAVDECKILSWKCDSLRTYLKNNASMAAIFSCILGKDIASKLYHIQEWLVKGNQNCAPNTRKNSLITDVRNYSALPAGQKSCGVTNYVPTGNKGPIPQAGPRGESYWLGRKPAHLTLADVTYETSV